MINVAIIGAGGIARKHAVALGAISGARIVAVNDVQIDRAEALASACGARAYADPRQAALQADLVYVLTPPSTHKELCSMAMAEGRHVVCEKPIASAIEDAQAMVDSAEQYGVMLMIAFNMRFKKGFRFLKDVVESGSLGQIYHFWTHRMGMGVGEGYNWRTDPDLLCGMTIESLSHDIDLMRWLVGEPGDLSATVYEARPDLPGFDTEANVALRLRSGGTAMIHASWSSRLGSNARGLLGTRGAAVAEGPGLWETRYFRLMTDEMAHERIEVLNDPLDVNSYVAENQHFVACAQGQARPLVAGAEGLRALEISNAILRSSRERRVVVL